MKNSSTNKFRFRNPFLAIFCILVHLSSIKSAQFIEYNYTLDLPQINLKNLQPSKTQQLKIYQGQLLKEYLVREPKQIGNVYQVEIVTKNDTPYAKELNDNVIEEVNVTTLKGIWFESFLWPIKSKTYLYSLQKSTSNSNEQNEEIISVTSSSPKQTQQNPIQARIFPLYVLLSSGKIQLIQNEFQMLRSKKQYSYSPKTQSNTTLNIASWSDGQLFHKHGRLYVLVEERFYTVSLTEIDEGSKLSIFFTLQNVGQYNVRSVIEDGNELYSFTEEAFYRVSQNNLQLILKFDEIYSTFNITDKRLVDVAIYNKNFYFLNHPSGIIKYSQQQKFSLLRIQHPQLSRKINVFNKTILVTYQIGADNYIQEYQFLPQEQKLYVNKIYDYHSDEEVKKILLYENYMVINRGAELNLGVHSLNRQLPLKFNSKSQVIISNFFLDQIYQLRSVGSSLFDTPSYLVVGPQNIQLIQFQTNPDQQMQQKWIKMGSQKIGIFEFDIRYTGTCKLSHFYPAEYCSITNSIQLIVTDIMGEEIHSWWIWVCIAIGGLVLCIFAWIFACRYFIKKQNEFESLASSRRSKSIANITIVEMLTQKQNEEKTQVN